MQESNQEGYRTLGWIINKSEQGIYLVVADEAVQKEIVEVYRHGAMEVYDYKRHPGSYSFNDLQKWVATLPEAHIFLFANFHLAIQDEESLKRLNFSRDMIEGLEKNFIFLVTPYGDDCLAVGAYDFYSFVKLRIVFPGYVPKDKTEERVSLQADDPVKKMEWGQKDFKQAMVEAYELIGQAKDAAEQTRYDESEKLLLKAWEIKKNLLGSEHLEIAEIDHELAEVYWRQGRYSKAEELYKKSLGIREIVLGEDHPDTAASYINLAGVYNSQGKCVKALADYFKAYHIFQLSLGTNHPYTQGAYEKMKNAYSRWKPNGDFKQWLEEKKGESTCRH